MTRWTATATGSVDVRRKRTSGASTASATSNASIASDIGGGAERCQSGCRRVWCWTGRHPADRATGRDNATDGLEEPSGSVSVVLAFLAGVAIGVVMCALHINVKLPWSW